MEWEGGVYASLEVFDIWGKLERFQATGTKNTSIFQIGAKEVLRAHQWNGCGR